MRNPKGKGLKMSMVKKTDENTRKTKTANTKEIKAKPRARDYGDTKVPKDRLGHPYSKYKK